MLAKVIGISDEVTTCECCGRTNLKRTVVISDGDGEVYYGTECAARAMNLSKAKVESELSMLRRAAIYTAERERNIQHNREMEEYRLWLPKTYGETRSNLERRRAYLAVLEIK